MYYEKFQLLCERNGVKPADVSRATGISTATLSSWKKGVYTPKQEKLKKIADFFDVSVEFLTSTEDDEESGYYYDPETARLAQEIYDNKELGLLLSASRKMSPDALRHLASLVDEMVRRENREDVDT